MRQISLDTETTGLFYYQGHRIIEIGCIEIIDRKITTNTFHSYINPERDVDKDAKKITGLTEYFLKDKPLFKDIINNFFDFINNADEIIMHNAAFDVNFINNELKILNYKITDLKKHFKVFDTLGLARQMHPGKKNNLDALCNRYNINIKERSFHGALLDANLLAQVYLEMTSTQHNKDQTKTLISTININKIETLKATKQELDAHINYIKTLKDLKKVL